MRSTLIKHAAILLPALAVAAVLPPAARPDDFSFVEAKTPGLLELDLATAQVTFSVPCQACISPSHGRSLLFNLQVFPSASACGEARITLNGCPLIQEWNGIHAEGNGSVPIANRVAAGHEPSQDIVLSWETACLFDTPPDVGAHEYQGHAAQLLTATVRKLGNAPVDDPVGFSVSFRQTARGVELLRLAVSPVPLSGALDGHDWRDPPADLRLGAAESTRVPEAAISQIAILRELEAEERRIQERIRRQKHLIEQYNGEHADPPRSDPSVCDNLSCIFAACLRKAHGAVKVLRAHLGAGPGRPRDDMDRYRFHSYRAGPEQAFTEAYAIRQRLIEHDHLDHRVNHPPGPHKVGDSFGQGPPPPPPPPPFDAPGGHGPPPPPPYHHRQHRHRPVHGVLMAIASMTGLACIVGLICRNCSTLRRRIKHDDDWIRAADYEEKRTLILDNGDRLQDAVRDELRQLRAARELAHDMIQAEQGRRETRASSPPSLQASSACPCAVGRARAHVQPYQPHHNAMPSTCAHPPLPTSSSYPYKSDLGSVDSDDDAPPAYEEDDDTSDVVANGFHAYTPSITSSAAFITESIIPDVSPRHSLESIRDPPESEAFESVGLDRDMKS